MTLFQRLWPRPLVQGQNVTSLCTLIAALILAGCHVQNVPYSENQPKDGNTDEIKKLQKTDVPEFVASRIKAGN